jgi:type IX secretion system PorP/SprF family membrane protein
MRATLLLVLSLLYCTLLKAQDPVFSQFYAAPMQLNPALTGLVAAPVIGINYRNQWPSLPNAYASYALSFSQYIPKINSGLGALVTADVSGGGLYATYKLGVFYAYDIRFSKDFYIRAGFDAYFVNARLAWNRLIFFDQLDLQTGAVDQNGVANPSNELFGKQSLSYFDMGAGFLFHCPYFYAGVSTKHLTVPKASLVGSYQDGTDEIPFRLSIHLGSEFIISKRNKRGVKTFLSPNILFVKQRQFHQLNIGTNIRYGLFLGGIYFRHTFSNADAVIMMIGVRKGVFKIGYSYDLSVAGLGLSSGGAHEVSISLNFGHKKQNHQNRYNDCLEIFR